MLLTPFAIRRINRWITFSSNVILAKMFGLVSLVYVILAIGKDLGQFILRILVELGRVIP